MQIPNASSQTVVSRRLGFRSIIVSLCVGFLVISSALFTIPNSAKTASLLSKSKQDSTANLGSTCWQLGEWYEYNGQFYSVQQISGTKSWTNARTQAQALVAPNSGVVNLATITSAEENTFIFNGIDCSNYWYIHVLDGINYNLGPYIGLFQSDSTNEPAGNWNWVTGESFGFSNWAAGEPNNRAGIEHFGHFYDVHNRNARWNDIDNLGDSGLGLVSFYIAESLSATCGLGTHWNETESGLPGVWTRRGSTNVFDALWNSGVTAVLTIDLQGSNVTVARRQSSDGNDCDYMGTVAADGRSVSGTYQCTLYPPTTGWQATINCPSCSVAPSNLVSWWRGEGNANDNLGSNNGTLMNGTGFVNGLVGQALNFDGVDDYVSVPASPSLDIGTGTGITIETWINPTNINSEWPLVEWTTGQTNYPTGNGLQLWMSAMHDGGGPGSLYANVVDASFNEHRISSAPGHISANTFSHVAVTYDRASGNAKLFVNGAIVAQSALGSFVPYTSTGLYLGHRPPGTCGACLPNTFYQGVIDETTIYNRALSVSEIQSIHNASSSGKCTTGGSSPTATPTATATGTPSSGPYVTSVQRTYSGYFLSGFNADNVFNVNINWGGSPGSVRFQINNGTPFTVTGNAAGVTQAFNMNSAFIPSFSPSVVKITPINGQGVTGPTWTGNIYVFPYPAWLQTAISLDPDALTITAGNGEMKAKFDFSFPNPPITSMKVSIPQSVPFVGGTFGIKDTQAIIKGSVSSIGTGSLSVGGQTGFEAMGNEVSGNILGTGNFLLNQNGLRLTSASLDFGLEGTIAKEVGILQAIPSLKPLNSVPILRQFNQAAKLRGEISPQVSVTSEWVQNPSTGGLKFDSLTGTGSLDLKGVLKMNATKHVSAQAWLGGGGSVTFGLPEPYLRSMSLSAEAGVEVKVNALFVSISRRYTREFSCGWTAGSSGVNCGESSLVAKNLQSSKIRLSLLHRPYHRFGDYEKFASAIQPNSSLKAGKRPRLTQENEFLTNVFPGAEPNLIPVGGSGRMMLYVRQNPTLPILQSTEIAWSYFDGTVWSAPQVIVNDTKAELSPVAGVDENGKVVAAWLRNKDNAFSGTISTFEELPEFYKKLEVVSSVFDPVSGTWGPITQLTDDLALDTSLRLSSDSDGKLLLTWQSNPSGEFTADAANPASLKYTFWNGSSWNLPGTVATGLVNISEHATAVDGNNAFIILPQDPDLNVINDRVLLAYVRNGSSWSSATTYSAGGVDNLLPSAVYDSSGQGRIVWLRDSDIVQATLSNPVPQLVRAASNSMAFFSLQLINNPVGNMTLVWQEVSDQGAANIFASIYDTASQTWSTDLRLNVDEWQASDSTGYYGTDGKLRLAYLATQINRITRTVTIDGQPVDIPNVPENGQTDLRLLEYTLANDLAVADSDLTVSTLNPEPDEAMTADLVIHNVGAFSVNNFNVKLFAGDPISGVLLDSVPVTKEMAGGSVRNVTFAFNYPASVLTFTAVVDSDNEVAEISEVNNVAVATITAPSPTPTPPAAAVSGVVSYGNAAAPPKFVSNVLVSAAGSPPLSVVTDAPGDTGGGYTLTGFGSGSYTVTPSKTGGVNGISSFDAARIAQHVSGAVPLTGNQLLVGDVSNNGSISSFDAANIANYAVSASPAGITGTWKFLPVSRNYASVSSNITGEDYSALLMGEVSGNWSNTGARPGAVDSGQWIVDSEDKTQDPIIVGVPPVVSTAEKEIIVPINVEGIAD